MDSEQWEGVGDLKGIVADALDEYERGLAAIASQISAGTGFPTSEEIRAYVRAMGSEALATTKGLLSELGEPGQALADMIRAHELGALPDASRLIRAGRAEALSARTIRRDLASLLRGEDINYDRYGLVRSHLTNFRTLASDGRRIVVDKGFEAVHLIALDQMRAAGHKRAAWVTSSRHRNRDQCDDLAEGGLYSLKRWPKRPHPHCGCMPGVPKT